MRSLIFQRLPSPNAALQPITVYITGNGSFSTTVMGRTVTALGTVRNGESMTFTVPDSACEIIAVIGNPYRFCAAELVKIPEGDSDIMLIGSVIDDSSCGEHFSFHGVSGTERYTNYQKPSNKWLIPVIAAALVMLVTIVVMSVQLTLSEMPTTTYPPSYPAPETFLDLVLPETPEEYTLADVTIPLPPRFVMQGPMDQTYLTDGAYIITVETVLKTETADPTAYDFARSTMKALDDSCHVQYQPEKEADFLNLEYRKNDKYYSVYFYEGADVYYAVTFSAESAAIRENRENIREIAKMITVK
ncbi:MAG: hypothetical protein IJW46_02655 [Clostridia bacterium]|nr:hypothetical protein [Clostridia bacterium]